MAISEPSAAEDGKDEADGDAAGVRSCRGEGMAGLDQAPQKLTVRARREARLAEALRANLRRRKTR